MVFILIKKILTLGLFRYKIKIVKVFIIKENFTPLRLMDY